MTIFFFTFYLNIVFICYFIQSTQASSNTNAMNASSINTLPTERSNYSSGVIYEYRAPNRTGLSTSSTYVNIYSDL